jgi:ureidoglycolate hydrolase
MNLEIKVEELSPSAYQEIGLFVQEPTHTPTIQDDIVSYWAGLANFELNGTIDVGWVTMSKRPFRLYQLERHFDTVEVVIPIDDVMVLPVAAGKDLGNREAGPNLEDIRGFYLRPGQMVTFSKGSWHFGGFPVKKDHASFLVMTQKGTADTDVVMKDLDKNVSVNFVV